MSEIAERITEFIKRAARANIRNNVILNSIFTWVMNRKMLPTPLEKGIAMDTVITCIFMSAIMTLFTSSSVRRAIASGELLGVDGALPEGSILRKLPTTPWKLGLSLGPIMAFMFMPWIVGFYHLMGLHMLTFWQVIILKAFYTAVITVLVIKWVVLRLIVFYAAQECR